MSEIKTAQQKLYALDDSLVQDIIDMPDDEITTEALERFGSPEAVNSEVERLRRIALGAVEKASKRKLVSELSGAGLDYWVGMAESLNVELGKKVTLLVTDGLYFEVYNPSYNPLIAYPIIERDGISTGCNAIYADNNKWSAEMTNHSGKTNNSTLKWFHAMGKTALIAAMRCKVASVYGEFVGG